MCNYFLKKGMGYMWVDELIPEYKKGRKGLSGMVSSLSDSDIDETDKVQLDSMIGSMTYSINWMETGRQPGVYRGVDRKDAYRHKQYDDMDIIPDINEELRKERKPFYMSEEQRISLIKLLENFSDRERQCFIMHEAEQLSMQKIADRLGIKKRTVQQYIERAREKVEKVAS